MTTKKELIDALDSASDGDTIKIEVQVEGEQSLDPVRDGKLLDIEPDETGGWRGADNCYVIIARI